MFNLKYDRKELMITGKLNRNFCRAVYSVSAVRDGFVCLIDDDKGRSITNAAEEVIAELITAGYDLSNKRVIYRDTMGLWDELVVKNGQFSDFRPIRETDLDCAIAKAREGK
jgi:hypothetical protein